MKMDALIRPVEKRDLARVCEIWNEVVLAANAFPGDEPLDQEQMWPFLQEQTLACCLEKDGEIYGVYILHPNNIGRCGHIANASFAVDKAARGQGLGEQLVKHCLAQLRTNGFTGLQFNAVVKSNKTAIALYQKLGFMQVGVIPDGYRRENGYEDILIFYHGAE